MAGNDRELTNRLVLGGATAVFALCTFFLRSMYSDFSASVRELKDATHKIDIHLAASEERYRSFLERLTQVEMAQRERAGFYSELKYRLERVEERLGETNLAERPAN